MLNIMGSILHWLFIILKINNNNKVKKIYNIQYKNTNNKNNKVKKQQLKYIHFKRSALQFVSAKQSAKTQL